VEHGPSQFEKRAFQRNVTATRRFRAGTFRAPPGWQYRRWTYGESLPMAYWAPAYWITNFSLYDLDRPPLGSDWVRNGPDALLVDTTTGEILEVVYNVFY
jgi:Ni/Co efflux regulator RcnB